MRKSFSQLGALELELARLAPINEIYLGPKLGKVHVCWAQGASAKPVTCVIC